MVARFYGDFKNMINSTLKKRTDYEYYYLFLPVPKWILEKRTDIVQPLWLQRFRGFYKKRTAIKKNVQNRTEKLKFTQLCFFWKNPKS